jgi:hypothetical protein
MPRGVRPVVSVVMISPICQRLKNGLMSMFEQRACDSAQRQHHGKAAFPAVGHAVEVGQLGVHASTLVFSSVMAVVRVWTWASSLPMARKYSGSVMGAFSCSRPSMGRLKIVQFMGSPFIRRRRSACRPGRWTAVSRSGERLRPRAGSGEDWVACAAYGFNGQLADLQAAPAWAAQRLHATWLTRRTGLSTSVKVSEKSKYPTPPAAAPPTVRSEPLPPYQIVPVRLLVVVLRAR